MSKFHSMVSRREFMKGLGMAGAGLGAASLVAPVFHDLDELAASPNGKYKRAWWVKQVDEPTVDIDWDMMQRHHGGHSIQSAAIVARYAGIDEYSAMSKPESDSSGYRMKQNQPGYLLRDQALSTGKAGVGQWFVEDLFGGPKTILSSMGEFKTSKINSPEALGVPKWTGTPEEATKMLKAAMVFYGAADVGASQVDEHHKKLIGLTGDNVSTTYFPYGSKVNWPPPSTVVRPMVFSDTEPDFRFDKNTGTSYIPGNMSLYSVPYIVPEDVTLNRLRPTTLGSTAQVRYRNRTEVRGSTQTFIKALGYTSMGDYPYRAVPAIATHVLAGLKENSRHTIMGISPEFGNFSGSFDMMTNLPLEPTKPIDAGMWKFCQSCGVCAEGCPSGSIEPKGGREPSFEIPASSVTPKHPPLPDWGYAGEPEYFKIGRKTYWTDFISCGIYVRSVATCNRCWGTCTFASPTNALIHNVVRGTMSVTPMFNSFFGSMHRAFDYGLKEGDAIEDWWDMALPSYGWDTALMSKYL
ncbi:MAG: reductive dehalogenase [Dehalogenimonas sp.]